MASSDYAPFNPEEVATRIMQSVLKGDSSALDHFLAQIQPEMLQHVLGQLKRAGDRAFERGKFPEAITYYTQCLAGTKVPMERAVLYSQMAICCLRNQELDEALQNARRAITAQPRWYKGWFRAAQVLEAKKMYRAAVIVLKLAMKRDPNDKTLLVYEQHLQPLMLKEKALERLSVDYSRFRSIVDPEDDDPSEEFSEKAKNCCLEKKQDALNTIEFATHLSAEQRKQLTQLLSQGGLVSQPNAADDLPDYGGTTQPALTIDLKTLRNRVPEADKQRTDAEEHAVSTEHIRKGLISILHTHSELTWPRRTAFSQLLHAPFLLDVYLKAIASVKDAPPSEVHSPLAHVWLFHGLGTSIPLVAATFLNPARHAITACTNHTYPFPFWMAERMLEINGQSERAQLRLVHKKITELTLPSGLENPLDAALLDLPFGKPSIVVIDQECFDATGVGKGVIQEIREVRSRYCTPISARTRNYRLHTVPAQMRVMIYGASVPPTANTFHALGLPETKKAARCINAARWNVGWESLSSTPYHGLGSPESGVTLLTQPIELYKFVFDGLLEDLDSELPLESPTLRKTLNVTRSGIMNCLLIRTEFLFKDAAASVSHQVFLTHNEHKGAGLWFNGAAGPAVTWVPPRQLELNSTVELDVELKGGCHISVRLPGDETGHQLHSWSVHRWQYDCLADTGVLQDLHEVLQEQVEKALSENARRLDNRPYLSGLSKNQTVELLLLNSCLGVSAVVALRAAAEVFASRSARPNPKFHITAVECSEAHAAVARRLVSSYAVYVNEDNLIRERAKERLSKSWISFGNTKNTAAETEIAGAPEASEESLLNAKSKVKSRITIVAKDPRCLRPPEAQFDATARLSALRVWNCPVEDAHGQQSNVQNIPKYNIPEKARIIVSQMVDCGLLGEGLLPILVYAHEALTKPNRTIIPAAARIYVAGVALGRHGFKFSNSPCNDNFPEVTVKSSCWYKHLLGDARQVFTFSQDSEYISVCLDDVEHQWVTPPIMAFQFDFENQPKTKSPLSSTIPCDNLINVEMTASEDGVLHALVFWCDLLFESESTVQSKTATCSAPHREHPRGYTTRPKSLNTDGYPGSSLRLCHRAKQAVYIMHDALAFRRHEQIPLTLWHTRCSVGAKWNRESIPDYGLRQRAVYSTGKANESKAVAWKECAEKHERTVEQFGMLASAQNGCKMLCNIADEMASLAANPHQCAPDVYIEPEEASWFCRNLYL